MAPCRSLITGFQSKNLHGAWKGYTEHVGLNYVQNTNVITSQFIKTHDSVVRPKKPARHTVSILTGRKITSFSHNCISVISYPIGTKFAAELPAS